MGILLATTWNLSKDSLNRPVSWIVLGVALALMLFTRLPTLLSLLLATAVGVAIILATSSSCQIDQVFRVAGLAVPLVGWR